jgi:hypothetical protein
MKFHMAIGGDHNDIESFYRFRKFLIFQHLINFSLKHHILPLFVLQIVVHKCRYIAM